MSVDTIAKDLNKVIRSAKNKETGSYDTQATVVRIEEDTAWVHIAGGVDETPVQRTIACQEGDRVQVRVGGGRAWITGNASAPPTDDRTALQARKAATTAQNTAEQAQETAEGVEEIATDAKSTANNAYTQAAQAKNIADTTNQYFWFSNGDLYFLSPDVEVDTSKAYYERTGEEGSYVYTAVTPAGTESPVSAGWYERFTETGAHITETPQDDFIADPDNGGGNLLARSNGIAIRDGEKELASFSANGVQVGTNNATHTIMDANGERFFAEDGTTQLANIGYGQAQGPLGPVVAPFYTLGQRGNGTVGAYSYAEGLDTVASIQGAHAEGYGTQALGIDSHAQNYGTIARGSSQTAIGMYNIAQGTSTAMIETDHAFIIGNGTPATRSNAFVVTWNGEVELFLDDTATSGTDYEIIQALTDLGWDSECIG